MIEPAFLFILIVGGLVGAAAGYLGSFMVLKRMSLVGDALTHVALPGMAIAMVFHLSPILGAFVALAIAVLGIWYLSESTRIYPEALVGIFFATSLALGILITPNTELLEALFGDIEKMTFSEGIAAIILSLVAIFLISTIAKKLILGVISEELAKSTGINIKKTNLLYLLLVGTIVALGVRFVGTLLMGGLVIIPAASAKNISKNLSSYYYFSILFGILSTVLGVIFARYYHFPSGPIVVLVSSLFFVASYLTKKVMSK